MNLEQLNVVELSSEEMVETTGGYCGPYPSQDPDAYDCYCYNIYVYKDITPC